MFKVENSLYKKLDIVYKDWKYCMLESRELESTTFSHWLNHYDIPLGKNEININSDWLNPLSHNSDFLTMAGKKPFENIWGKRRKC